MPKAPFERIFSLSERKKILANVLKDKVKIIVKIDKNLVFEVKAEELNSAFDLSGVLRGQEVPSVRNFDKVTILFHVENERYFMTTQFKLDGTKWSIVSSPHVYKFNRRSAFRVHIPEKTEVVFQIFAVRNIEMNKKARIIEMSSNGARMKFLGETRFSSGTILKGTLQWGKGKLLPVDALIVHSPAKNTYGVRFVNLTGTTMNRLKMLSVEIQREIYLA